VILSSIDNRFISRSTFFKKNIRKLTNKYKKMARFFAELIKKHGVGMVMSAIAMDGYRRTVNNDNNSAILKAIEEKREAARKEGDTAAQTELQRQIKHMNEKAENCAVRGRQKEAAEEHHKAVEAYSKNPTEYHKKEVDRLNKKFGPIL